MKELEELKKDRMEVSATKQEPRELKFIGSLRPQGGQKCFELEVSTGIVKEAEFEAVNSVYHNSKKVNRKIIVKDGHLYLVAINKVNAQRKFIQMLMRL